MEHHFIKVTSHLSAFVAKHMSKEKKNLHTGIIEKDERGNYHCGEFLLDYRHTESKFKVGDKIYIKSAIANPSDASREQYPMKTKDFFLSDSNPAPQTLNPAR